MTNNNILYFIGGATIGSFVTWFGVKGYYKKRNEQDYEALKCHYESKEQRVRNTRSDEEPKIDKALAEKEGEIKGYAQRIRTYGYATDYSGISKKKEQNEESVEVEEKPYIVSPEAFAVDNDYDVITLVYHANGVLVDDNGDVVDNSNEIVPKDFMNYFGEYEEDAVYCYNPTLKANYEILLDNTNYPIN